MWTTELPYERREESRLYRRLSVSSEVNLRQLSIKVAMNTLDIYLMKAVDPGMVRVSIIHGRSGGDMRKAVHDFLSSHHMVEDFEYPAAPAEGGPGVTVARLLKI